MDDEFPDDFDSHSDMAFSWAVRMPDSAPKKASFLGMLGHFFSMRFDRRGDVEDINKAIYAQGEATRLIPDSDSDKPAHLNAFGRVLLDRFNRLGDVADVNKAVSAQDYALRLIPDSHPHKPTCLDNLGSALLSRFQHVGNLADIERAVLAYGNAVQLTPVGHPERHIRLNNLGNSFLARFDRLGEVNDVRKAVSAHNDAVKLTPDGNPDKPACLDSLGNSLLARFECLGELADINGAVSASKDAVRLTADGNPDKAGRLSNLGNSFLRCFQRFGEVADIDKAVSAYSDAVRLTPDNHPNKPASLNNLGTSLQARFRRLGEIADIDNAVTSQTDAVRLTPDGHPDKPGYLTNLGTSLFRRFERLEQVADIDKGIAAHKDAVRLTPDGHSQKSSHLNNLANSLQHRFECFGEVMDINNAVSARESTVKLTPNSHFEKPGYLSNLGISLMRRCERLADIADINKAILVQKDAVGLTPEGHVEKPRFLMNLGSSYACRFRYLRDAADLDSAILQYSSAARISTGPALTRFRAALMWADHAVQNGHPSCLDAYSRALELLPRVAWLGLPMAERHRELANIGNIVRDAAAAAIKAEECDKALEWLEQGRSIVWGQLLHLRTPVDDLRVADPALADRLSQVSARLERASSRDMVGQPNQQLTIEQVGRNHRELASEWDTLVESARAVPGFEDFLKPKSLSQLNNAARLGPVVVINVHKDRCDALVLMADQDNVIHVPLDHFSYDRAQKLHHLLGELLSNSGVRARDQRGTTRVGTQVDRVFRNILSVLWKCVVKPVLEMLAFPASGSPEPPRIWWCATGPLAFLPLHAAGLYETTELGTKISDFVTSSYTPTLTALLDTPRMAKLPEFQLLAITQPSTPGQSSLPNTEEELKRIRRHTGNYPVKSLEGAEATVERVVKSMNESSWVHLACHGGQDVASPTKSAFFLQDGRLALSEIIKMSLPHADFAFLSACQTATGDQSLAEEAVHLAAGMLLAGYRGVIATIWSIKDNDAPLVADEVYAYIFQDGQPERTRAAHALHRAVQSLRDDGAPFFSWVPFIHVGL